MGLCDANHWHLAIVNHRLIKKGVNKQIAEDPHGVNKRALVKVTKTELRDINRLMGYRDAQ